MRATLFTVLLSAAASCATAPPTVPDPALRILFIGNSLTSANDLPGLVRRLAESDPSRQVMISSVTFGELQPGGPLEPGRRPAGDRGRTLGLRRAAAGALGAAREPGAAGRIRRPVRRGDPPVGGRPAVYMVWPSLDRESEWDAVTANHQAAAEAVSGVLFPAGETLRAARRADPGIVLFEADGFHPTLAGSYGAALMIYARAAGVSPVGLTVAAAGIALPTGQVRTLEAAAAEALAQFPDP